MDVEKNICTYIEWFYIEKFLTLARIYHSVPTKNLFKNEDTLS